MDDVTAAPRAGWHALWVAAVVAVGTWLLALPGILASWQLTPDAVDYVGIANAWIEGRGFRVPVVYSYFLADLAPPAPALAVRAPVMSILFAIPLALGVSLTGLAVVHVIWAGIVGGGVVLLARRLTTLPAAAACGIAIAWSFAWVLFAEQLLTEVTSMALVGLLVLHARRGVGSRTGALALAMLTFVAWCTRPTLGVMLPAILLAAVWERGPRASLRAAPLWVYAVAFVSLQQAYVWIVSAATGFPPYAHYGMMAEILRGPDAALFQTEYVGMWQFLSTRGGEVWQLVLANARLFLTVTVVGTWYHHAGLLALPAIGYGLFRGGPSGFELRLVALATLAFAATAAIGYGGYDPLRYPLPSMAGVWLLTCVVLGEGATRFASTRPARAFATRVIRFAPLVLVGALVVEGSPPTLEWVARSWASFRENGTVRQMMPTGRAKDEWSAVAAGFCDDIDPDALVAAHDPWTLHVFCGNAAYWLPPDLDTAGWVDRYLDERAPGYVIEDGTPRFAGLRESTRLERVAKAGRHTVYRVVGAPARSRPWEAPIPLARRGAAQVTE